MDFLYSTVNGVPVFYIVPVLFFGPILIWVLAQIGILDVFKIPGEMRAKWKREADEKAQLTAERRKKMGEAERVIRPQPKRTVVQWAGQALVYAIMAAPIAYCSQNPTYRLHADDEAQLKLSLSIPGEHMVPCRKLSREELAKLPPQKRGKKDCGRERWPVHLAVTLNDKVLFSKTKDPGGLSGDGPSLFYEKVWVPAGKHRLVVSMKTSGAADAPERAALDTEIELVPSQIIVIKYRQEDSTLVLQ